MPPVDIVPTSACAEVRLLAAWLRTLVPPAGNAPPKQPAGRPPPAQATAWHETSNLRCMGLGPTGLHHCTTARGGLLVAYIRGMMAGKRLTYTIRGMMAGKRLTFASRPSCQRM
jgi:hypothetical protein